MEEEILKSLSVGIDWVLNGRDQDKEDGDELRTDSE